MKKFLRLICFALIFGSLVSFSLAQDSLPFEDVKESNWFYDEVSRAWEIGIIEGKSPSVFAPRTVMTRAELVTMLSRLTDVNMDGMADLAAERFNDIGSEAWYAPYVGWGVSAGIVTGYNNGTFQPNNPISRQELAVMIVRFMDYELIKYKEYDPVIDTFADFSSVGSWARGQVETLRSTGIIKGDANGFFNPKMSATRAEVAAIAVRYFDFSTDYFTDFAPKNISFERTVDSDFIIGEEFIEDLVKKSDIDYVAYDRVSVCEADTLISRLNELDSATRKIDIEIEFVRGDVTCIGRYVLTFTREAPLPPVDMTDPTPENIGVQYKDDISGFTISEAIHFEDINGNPYTSTGTGIHGGHENKLVRTPYGTFAVYLTGERKDDTYNFVWDQFKVFRITSEGVSVLLEAEYPHSEGSCLPTIFAGDPGKVYVTVISCDNLKYHSDNLREGAWLDVYEIDAASGTYEKYSANPDFEITKVHGYGYSQPVPDIINGKIYALYTGGGVPGYLSWFVYDIDSHSWNTECFTVETDFRLAYFYLFADGNGGFYGIGQRDILCSDLGAYLGLTFKSSGYAWDALYVFSIKDVMKEEYEIFPIREPVYEQTDEAIAAQGIGGSAYRDDKGNLHVLYQHTNKRDITRFHAVYDKDLNLIKNDEIVFTDKKNNNYTLTMTQSPEGAYYIFAVNNYMTVKEAKVEIWASWDGLNFKKEYENIPLMRDDVSPFGPQLKFITSNTRNNSTMDCTVGFLVFESVDGKYHYYYYSVDFGELSIISELA